MLASNQRTHRVRPLLQHLRLFMPPCTRSRGHVCACVFVCAGGGWGKYFGDGRDEGDEDGGDEANSRAMGMGLGKGEVARRMAIVVRGEVR